MNSPRRKGFRSAGGFTLLELLMVLGVFGVIMSISALNLRGLEGNLTNASSELQGFLKQTRARAMATTSAYRVVFDSREGLSTQRANNCGAAESEWTTNERTNFKVRERILLQRYAGRGEDGEVVHWQNGDTVVCFTSRGLAADSLLLVLRDRDKGTRTVLEVLRGGAVSVR